MARILGIWLLLAAFLLFPSLILAGVARAQDLDPLVARELAPGVRLLGTPAEYAGPAISNISIIEQSDGLVLVDSGATIADGRRVVAYIRTFTNKPVKALLITHWHNDHPLGIAAIRDAWPHVRVIATVPTRAGLLGPASTTVGLHPDERFETMILNQGSEAVAQVSALRANPATPPELRQRYDRYIANLQRFARDYRGTYLVPPTETFSDELLIDDSERPVRLMFLGRANTAGDAIAWLPRQRIVFTGDIVVSPIPFGFFSYPEDWIGVLQRLKALDFVLLVPGHGEPQTNAAYLDRLITTIGDIRGQVGPLARQGLSLDEVRERVDFSTQSDIFGASPRLRTAFQQLWLTPMVENAWKEARGIEIVQGEGEATPATVRRRSR